LLAVCQFLADGSDAIVIGDQPEEQVVLCAHPVLYEAPIGINEQTLSKPDESLVERAGDRFDDEEGESEQDDGDNV
jgi:hypothetical protein